MGRGVKIALGLLFAFNFIFVLIGLAGIIAGALIRLKYDDYEVLVSKSIGGVSILLIGLGGIIFIVAFFGCCGAIKKNVIMLNIFIILMVIPLVIEIAGAIATYVYKDELKGYVEDGIQDAMKNYNETKFQDAMDTVQKEFKCCGVTGASNYAKYHITNFPKSCCKGGTQNCSPITAYSEGCVDKLFDYLKDHMAVVAGNAVAIAVIQIIGIIFACVVRRDVKGAMVMGAYSEKLEMI